MGYRSWDHKELDMTGRLTLSLFFSEREREREREREGEIVCNWISTYKETNGLLSINETIKQ